MMFGGYDYDPYFPDDYWDWPHFLLHDESFFEHYADEIEDRVIPALDSDEVAANQLTLFGDAY